MPTDEIHTILKYVQQVPDCDIVLCGKTQLILKPPANELLTKFVNIIITGDTHQVVVSAKIWLDLMHKTASKGTAIRHLQK
ncbi:hypothetical protein AYY23_03185 [Photobacterium kishitanii]|nr:hypothetical protein AYY23_03185 [Photobacterium kishitanii]